MSEREPTQQRELTEQRSYEECVKAFLNGERIEGVSEYWKRFLEDFTVSNKAGDVIAVLANGELFKVGHQVSLGSLEGEIRGFPITHYLVGNSENPPAFSLKIFPKGEAETVWINGFSFTEMSKIPK